MPRPSKHDGVIYRRKESAIWWMRYRDKRGQRQFESTGCTDWQEANKKLRERFTARDQNVLQVVRRGEQLLFQEWADHFMQNYSQPPIREPKTHEANGRAMKHLVESFSSTPLAALTADEIELYLRMRLRQKVRRPTQDGFIELGLIKPATVHQEFRVLRRTLNVAVRKRLLPANPCWGVEFPVRVKGMFRPHYMTSSEQQKIEFHAPGYLANAVRIIAETGLRIYKELTPMRKDQIDLVNATVWIPESKTENGIAEAPLTEVALQAFRDQIQLAGPGPWLFPSGTDPAGHQKTFKTAWHATLRRAGIPYFRIYDLRSTFATRLSAGGVADEWVTQLLRQGDAKVSKKYSQMKLQMKREVLLKLNRQANEQYKSFDTVRPN
jgi:integrase